jgi:predicted ribosome quality control (RQC) complex YloA/Tae2 family protein
VNLAELEIVCSELREALVGKYFGKIFPLGRRSLAIDFRLPGPNYLFIAAESAAPRIYLIKRRLRDLERSSEHPSPFHLLLKKYLSGARLLSIEQVADDRILSMRFAAPDEIEESVERSLIIQLTGKSSNLFLLNENDLIIGLLADKDVDGQRIGEQYKPPKTERAQKLDLPTVEILPEDEGSISAALDRVYQEQEAEKRFRSLTTAAERELNREIAKREKLIGRLNSDLAEHGDAIQWKRFGDLLLANTTTAKRSDNKVTVIDYFDEATPEVEIDINESDSLTDAAQKYFRKYSKAQNAASEIKRRIESVNSEIEKLLIKQARLEQAIADHDESFFESAKPDERASKKREKQRPGFSGARQFTSSNGFEIFVGKKATDNDYLTFRVAGSLDTWLHAADYPGSHVIIRNPNRKEIPPQTLFEAAQLAAFYSSGKSQPKAAVHYTQKKFVNKPRGAAPGLVRLASFKTILVEPAIPAALDQKTQN